MTKKYAKFDALESNTRESGTWVNEVPFNLSGQLQIQEPKQDWKDFSCDNDEDNIQAAIIRSKKLCHVFLARIYNWIHKREAC